MLHPGKVGEAVRLPTDCLVEGCQMANPFIEQREMAHVRASWEAVHATDQ